MPLVTTKEMFEKAKEGKYAIGAFNVNNMEIIQGVINAATKEQSPVIMQMSPSAIKYAGIDYLMSMTKVAIDNSNVPVAIHLDHGTDFDICKQCIDAGFTSVMIDGSKHEYNENIELTKKVVEYAHSKGVVVEAELGKLAGIEDDINVSEGDASFTDPDQALEFIQKTGCDSLAVAIGTSHGAYKFKGTPNLRFDILEKIVEKTNGFPIVLHGASSVIPEYLQMCNEYGGNIPGAQGIPNDMLLKAGQMGVVKVNMDTDIRLAMTASIRKFLAEHLDTVDVRGYLGEARDLIEQMVINKIRNTLGSNNKI